ncbi:MAG: hypothetical protein AB7S26_03340 [Sandaracinaceae bacterium]
MGWLLVGALMAPAHAAAQGEIVLVIPASQREASLARYLASAFDGGAVRADLGAMSPTALRSAQPSAALLRVDLSVGELLALRAASADPLRRPFDPAVARVSPFAIAVAASELLALPLSERAPDPARSPAGSSATDARATDARANEQGRNEQGRNEQGRNEPGRNEQGRNEQSASARGANRAGASDEHASDEPASDDGAALTRSDLSRARAASPEDAAADSDARDVVGVSLRGGLGIAMSWIPATQTRLTDFYRPSLELGVAFGTSSIQGIASIRGDLAGYANRSVATPDADALEVWRHGVRAQLGGRLRFEPIELGLLVSAGVEITQASVVGAMPAVPAYVRPGFAFGVEAWVGLILGAGFRIEAGGGLALDPDGERLLVRGENVAADGPLAGVARAALVWESF